MQLMSTNPTSSYPFLQISETVTSCKEEIRTAKVQHETERQQMINELQCKELALVTKFLREKSELQAELRAQKDAIIKQQREANERWNSRPSLPKDIERIKSM